MTTTTTQLRDNVQSTAADLEILVSVITGDAEVDAETVASVFSDHGHDLPGYDRDADEYDTSEAAEIAREILDEWPLEFVEHGKRTRGGEWEITHVVVVFGVGGPHVELDTSERAVMGYWGVDRERAPVESAVIDYFESLTDY